MLKIKLHLKQCIWYACIMQSNHSYFRLLLQPAWTLKSNKIRSISDTGSMLVA